MEKDIQLVDQMEAALLSLLSSRKEAIQHYTQQDAFSHMVLSVAHWHADLYWNLCEKSDSEFEEWEEDDCDSQEFIILSDFDELPPVEQLCASLDALNEEEHEGDSIQAVMEWTHSCLAAAFRRPLVMSALAEVMNGKCPDDPARLDQVIQVRDTDHYFEYNFLSVAS
ncbi:hypothetical protein [Litoribacillus peritrichatus]|uniref:Uncharacterized protein n=1 Tax=Litoribacillus peritrichatus TaxID=718191 RepID=A0ABP7M155_9GAMM